MGKRNAVERYVISSARHESRGRQAKKKQQKKEDMKQSSFCCDLQAKSHDVGKDKKLRKKVVKYKKYSNTMHGQKTVSRVTGFVPRSG